MPSSEPVACRVSGTEGYPTNVVNILDGEATRISCTVSRAHFATNRAEADYQVISCVQVEPEE